MRPSDPCAFCSNFDFFLAAPLIIRVRKAGFSMAGDIFPKAKNQSMIALTPADWLDWLLRTRTRHLIPADLPS